MASTATVAALSASGAPASATSAFPSPERDAFADDGRHSPAGVVELHRISVIRLGDLEAGGLSDDSGSDVDDVI